MRVATGVGPLRERGARLGSASAHQDVEVVSTGVGPRCTLASTGVGLQGKQGVRLGSALAFEDDWVATGVGPFKRSGVDWGRPDSISLSAVLDTWLMWVPTGVGPRSRNGFGRLGSANEEFTFCVMRGLIAERVLMTMSWRVVCRLGSARLWYTRSAVIHLACTMHEEIVCCCLLV